MNRKSKQIAEQMFAEIIEKYEEEKVVVKNNGSLYQKTTAKDFLLQL